MMISATSGLTVQLDGRGELGCWIYFQRWRFSQRSVGGAGLRVPLAVGVSHCDIAHCQDVKNVNMLAFLVVM